MIYSLHCFSHYTDIANIANEIKLMAKGYYSAEFHPKRKKLKGYQKKKK